MELVERMLRGEKLALSRLVTMVENGSPEVSTIMKEIYPRLGRAYKIGVTGPPGAGKSTLVDALTLKIRRTGATVGVIAVDPTSPFSGGAVLGDRIRMQQHYLDDGVFIRSMGTRGSRGGLARSTKEVMKLLDAFGKDFVVVETVGVGQTELDVVEAVDTTIVVLVPESGDTIQAMKAGLLEIADVFLINKADRPGAQEKQLEIQAMLGMGQKQGDWDIPVILAQANNDVGVDELFRQIQLHREFLIRSGLFQEKRRELRGNDFAEILRRMIRSRLEECVAHDGPAAAFIEQILCGDLDPYSGAEEILKNKALLESCLAEPAGSSVEDLAWPSGPE